MSFLQNITSYFHNLFSTSHTLPPPTSSSPAPCHLRLDTDSAKRLDLPDGRKLGYAEYGSPAGRPIFMLHGLPGSRFDGAFQHDVGLKLNARIISLDRPGIGWSSPQKDRKLLDFPKDLEVLADELGLDTFGILGISGGGPYALACAYAFPRDKLKAVSIVCGLGPSDIGMRGAGWPNYIAFSYGYWLVPEIVIRYYWKWWRPEGRLDLTDEERLRRVLKGASSWHKKDLEVLKDEDILRLSLRSAKECFAQGYDGVAKDVKVMCRDYGFHIEDIRKDLPVQLWYGTLDELVPANHGVQIAARLGDGAKLRVEEDTHASLQINWQKNIVEDLIACI